MFGTIASRLEIIQNEDIQSFKSDGVTLEISPDFLNEITLDEMQFVFANGAMHASLAHQKRKNNRSGWLWQLSTDYAVNDILVDNGMSRPDLAHYSKRFSGLYAEEIYAELKDDILRDDENLEYEADNSDDVNSESNDESSQGSELNGLEESSLCNDSDEEVEAELILAEQLFEEFAQSIIDKESLDGEIPQGLERLFTLEVKGKIDWQSELRLAIDKFYKDDYQLFPSNKKFLHLGFYLPSTVSNRFKFSVAIDSSGSVDEELLNEFLSELNSIMNTIPNYEITLLICDDKIREIKTFYSGDILEFDLDGGGATDFKPVFEYIQENLIDTKLLLYFTDLDGTFPLDEPNYDVRWISKIDISIPFGEIILLDD